MKITVNGKEEELSESINIDVFVEHFGYDRKKIALEINKEIVTKSMYGSVEISEGDVIEVVTFVGGG